MEAFIKIVPRLNVCNSEQLAFDVLTSEWTSECQKYGHANSRKFWKDMKKTAGLFL